MPREMPVAWSNLLDALKSWQAPYYESRSQALQEAKMKGDWKIEGARLAEQRRASMAQEDIQRDTLAETTRFHKAQEENWEADMALRTRMQEWAEHMDKLTHSLALSQFWLDQRLALSEEEREQQRHEWAEEDRPLDQRILESKADFGEARVENQKLLNEARRLENDMLEIAKKYHEDMTVAELNKLREEVDRITSQAELNRAQAEAYREGLMEGQGGMAHYEQVLSSPEFQEAVDGAYTFALQNSGYDQNNPPRGDRGWSDAYAKFIGALEGLGMTEGHPSVEQFKHLWETGQLPSWMKGKAFEYQARRNGIWEQIPQGSPFLDLYMPDVSWEGMGATRDVPKSKPEPIERRQAGGEDYDPIKGLRIIKDKIQKFFQKRKSQGGPGAAHGAELPQDGVFSDDFLEAYRRAPRELGYPTPPTIPPYGQMPQEGGGQFGQQFLERQTTPLGGEVNPGAIGNRRQQYRPPTPFQPGRPNAGRMEPIEQPQGRVNPSVLDRFFAPQQQGQVNPGALQGQRYRPPEAYQPPRPNPNQMQPMGPQQGQFNRQTFDRMRGTTPLGGQVNPDALQGGRYRPPESFQPYRPQPSSIESMRPREQQGQFGKDFMGIERPSGGQVSPEAVNRYRQPYQRPQSYQPPRPAAKQFSPMRSPGTPSQPQAPSTPRASEQAPRERIQPPPATTDRGPSVRQPPEVIDRTEQDTRGQVTTPPEEERGFFGRIGEKVKGAVGDIFNLDKAEEQIVEYEGDVYVVKKNGRVFTIDGQEVTQESFKSNIIRKMMKEQEKAKQAETEQKQQQRRFMGIERR
jgi:hypothetical protein